MPLILALAPPIALVGVFLESAYDDDDGCCYCDDNGLLKCISGLICVPLLFAIGLIGSVLVLALFLVPGMVY
jgi:hypothetical protein